MTSFQCIFLREKRLTVTYRFLQFALNRHQIDFYRRRCHKRLKRNSNIACLKFQSSRKILFIFNCIRQN